MTDKFIAQIDKNYSRKRKKRYYKYEQIKPCCIHHGWKWQMGKKRKRGRNYGHLKGVEIVKKVVEGSLRLKIKHLTFYVFSTENWKRPKSEINYLFKLIFLYFTKELKNVIKNGIKISIIGNINPLPSKLKKLLKTEKKNK